MSTIAQKIKKGSYSRTRALKQHGFHITMEGYKELAITKDIISRALKVEKRWKKTEHTFKDEDKLFSFIIGEAFLEVYKSARRVGLVKQVFDKTTKEGTKRFKLMSKRREIKPRPEHLGSIAVKYANNDADYYIFASAIVDKTRDREDPKAYQAWLCGHLPKQEFHRLQKFFPKDSYDSSNGYRTRTDCYSVSYENMENWKRKHLITLSDEELILQAATDATENEQVTIDEISEMTGIQKMKVLKICRSMSWALQINNKTFEVTATDQGISAAYDPNCWEG